MEIISLTPKESGKTRILFEVEQDEEIVITNNGFSYRLKFSRNEILDINKFKTVNE